MARCHYCDYDHEGMPSLYNAGLRTPHSHRRVLYRPEVDKDVCSTCWNASHDFKDPEEGTEHFVDIEFDDLRQGDVVLPKVVPGEDNY